MSIIKENPDKNFIEKPLEREWFIGKIVMEKQVGLLWHAKLVYQVNSENKFAKIADYNGLKRKYSLVNGQLVKLFGALTIEKSKTNPNFTDTKIRYISQVELI